MNTVCIVLTAAFFWIMVGVSAAGAATLEASYFFNNTLASSTAGAPNLVPTDPLGMNAFVADTVSGSSRTVYQFNGNASPPTQQAGLTFDNSGALVGSSSYSLDMTFKLFSGTGAWRRLVDVQNRQSDDGLYIDPSNHLDIFPVIGGTTTFVTNAYQEVTLVNNGGSVTGYLNGNAEFTVATTVMNINNPQNFINFFLDNVVGGGQGEFSSGDVAQIRLWNGALTAAEVAGIQNPFGAVPEPATALLLGSSLVALGMWTHRRSHAR
jgi:concanavalin A-like lectin/glucanase superfamily protein